MIPSAVAVARHAGLNLSAAQRCALRLWSGEPLEPDEAALLPEIAGVDVAGRSAAPPAEMWVNAGRRSGKTGHIAGPVIATAVLSTGWESQLAPGEVARIPLLAPKLDLLRQLRDVTIGIFSQLGIAFEATDREIRILGRPLRIELTVADNISPRGGTAVLAVVDEAALLPTEPGADGRDADLFPALRPSLATLLGRLLVISSPWMQEGVHYETCKRLRGRMDGRAIALSGPSWLWNPALTRARCEELEPDPRRFDREYGARAGATEDNYLSRDEILACIDRGVRERPALPGVYYTGGLDLATRKDRSALAIAHGEFRGGVDVVVVDAVRHWTPRPGHPLEYETLVPEIAAVVRTYRAEVSRDAYSGDAIKVLLNAAQIPNREVSMAPAAQAQRFNLLAQRIRTRTLRLVDSEPLIRELCDLRVKLHQGGRMEIAAPNRRGAHDDIADALALAVERASWSGTSAEAMRLMSEGTHERADPFAEWRQPSQKRGGIDFRVDESSGAVVATRPSARGMFTKRGGF